MNYSYLTEKDYEIAKENGIPYNLVYNRVYEYGWDVERAITEPVHEKNRPTGVWDEWKGIAEANGVNHQLFRTRMSRGKTPEQAALEPVRKARGLAVKKKSINLHLAAMGYQELLYA